MHYTYTPHGVCSRKIDIELEGDVVKSIQFLGGCNGNLQGVSALCAGRKVEEVIPLLQGINCGGKGTSCPDQLSKALEEAVKAAQA